MLKYDHMRICDSQSRGRRRLCRTEQTGEPVQLINVAWWVWSLIYSRALWWWNAASGGRKKIPKCKHTNTEALAYRCSFSHASVGNHHLCISAYTVHTHAHIQFHCLSDFIFQMTKQRRFISYLWLVNYSLFICVHLSVCRNPHWFVDWSAKRCSKAAGRFLTVS